MKNILFISLALFICSSFKNNNTIKTPAREYEVEYIVTCAPADFNVTYANSTGGINQEKITGGSFRKTVYPMSGDFVSIYAQANNKGAHITAKIYIKDDLFKSSSSDGDYVIANASGLLPK